MFGNLHKPATSCHNRYGIMFFIRIENKPVFYRSWYVKHLRYVNDLVNESDLLMSPTELINKFNLKGTFLQAFGIMCAIPD